MYMPLLNPALPVSIFGKTCRAMAFSTFGFSSRMHVMPTGMHDARVGRFIGYIVFFFNGQGIHIGPEQDRFFFRIFSPYQCNDAGFYVPAGKSNACLRQLLLYEFGSFKFAERK